MEKISLINPDAALTFIERNMGTLRDYIDEEDQTIPAGDRPIIVKALRYDRDVISAIRNIENVLGLLIDSKFPEDKLNSIRTEYKSLKDKCEESYKNGRV